MASELHPFVIRWQSTRTDASGHFRLAHFPKRQPYQVLSVRHPEFLDGRPKVLAQDAGDAQIVRLRRGVEVTGTVLGPRGQPIEAAQVYLRGAALANREPDAVTTTDGRFRLVSSPDWRKLCAWAEGFAPSIVDVELVSSVRYP